MSSIPSRARRQLPEVKFLQRLRWRGSSLPRLIYFGLAMAMAIVVGIPLLYMAVSSFRPEPEVFRQPPAFLPVEWTWTGYQALLNQSNIPVAFRNSVLVSTSASTLGVVISIGFCYVLTRFRFPGMKLVSYLMLIVYMMPKILLVIPIYTLWGRLQLEEGLLPLTLIYTSRTLPFGIWMLRSYLAGIPVDLEEAALVDGATRLRAFFQVVLPLARPGIIATLIFCIILSWQEVLFATIFATSEQNMVLSTALANMLQEQGGWFTWGMVNAAAVVATVPMLFFFTLIQRQLVSGFTAGAVKG